MDNTDGNIKSTLLWYFLLFNVCENQLWKITGKWVNIILSPMIVCIIQDNWTLVYYINCYITYTSALVIMIWSCSFSFVYLLPCGFSFWSVSHCSLLSGLLVPWVLVCFLFYFEGSHHMCIVLYCTFCLCFFFFKSFLIWVPPVHFQPEFPLFFGSLLCFMASMVLDRFLFLHIGLPQQTVGVSESYTSLPSTGHYHHQ